MGRDYLKVGQIMEILRQRGFRLIAINDGVDSARAVSYTHLMGTHARRRDPRGLHRSDEIAQRQGPPIQSGKIKYFK